MNPFRMPPQIFRLVLLIFAIVVSYLVARTLLTPSSFREYGFYRGASLMERAAQIPVFAGKVACGKRNSDILQILAKSEHKTLSCETCHGVVSKDQLDDPAGKLAHLDDKHCIRCHEANPSRPTWFKQINVKDHYADPCMDCHDPHQPNEEK